MTAAVAILLSLLLGSAVTGPLTAVQIAALVGMGIQGIPKAVKLEQQVIVILQSPAFREWVARNGDKAIQLQPGEITER